ncbi:unnamed protein product [Nezara viridula]|uniref:Uncharacterized protein n=1 Tax=Nezara viridula TaxID=85310 RepID=A0A9P0HGE5_NEZVI|nr:unnamed protein product [Nezara viridula]
MGTSVVRSMVTLLGEPGRCVGACGVRPLFPAAHRSSQSSPEQSSAPADICCLPAVIIAKKYDINQNEFL